MRYLAPIPSQFLDETGTPYYNGKVYVYIHGDSQLALADIYQNAETDELAENPAPLDSHGMWQAFVDADRSFDYLVKDSDGNVVASFYDVTFPTGEGVPEIYVESRDGTINVEKSLSEGRQTFNIEVNKDTFKPAYARFTHSTVSGSGTDVELDSFEPDGDGNSDIYLTDGKLTLAKGLYHVSMNMCLGNDSLGNEYLEVIISFGGNELKKVWDGSFIHEESVELGMDISVEEDSSVVLPTINDFPEGMYCSITRLDVHSVGGAGAAGSHSVEHDGTLVGDGTHENPLGVKDYSEIRSDVDAVSESLERHETSDSAHQDIRDDIEYEANRAQAAEAAAKTEVVQGENCTIEKTTAADGHDVYVVNADGKPQVQADWAQNDSSAVDYIKNRPQNLVQDANYVHTDNNYTTAEKNKLGGIESGAQVNVIEKVKVNGTEQGVTDKAVDISVPTESTATPLKDGTASAGSSSQWARGDHRHPTDDSREAVANKVQSIDDSSTTEYPSSKAVADFVNSSVATNTATFLGNFSLADLGLTYPATEVQVASALNSKTWPTGYPTNNDYVYVEIRNPQSTIDDKVQRYKYRDGLASWGYEYTLNNSSFTAEEKAAIDSGITSQDVTNLRADHTTLGTHIADTSNPHNVTAAQVGAEPAFSVLPIDKGGTGKTTGKAATNNLFSDINNLNTDPDDTARIVFKYGSPSDSNGIFFARAITNLWNYIKGKISSVLGLTASSYGGNAATATSATTAAGYTNDGAIASALDEKAVSSVYNETDPRNLRSFIKCQGTTNQFYRKLATAIEVDSGANSSVIKVEGCVGAWFSGDTTDFSIVVRTRNAVKFETNVFKRIGGIYAFEKVDFELYEESNGTYSLWLHSVGTYTVCTISAFAYGGAYIAYDGTDGTPTGTLVASASQNYKLMMVTDGDGSNTTSTFTKASGDTSTMTSGGKLSAIFTAISSFFASLKALAFKDKASYNDLSSGVQSSLDKADSALQSHQSVTDNDPTLAWGTRSKVGTIGGTDLHVTMPSNPASGKLDSTGDASNTTATFSAAITRTNIASGEKLSVLFGKIAKWFGDLGTAAFKTLVTAWSGTTSNDNIPSEKLVKDSLDLKQDSLGISSSGDTGKFLNERGAFTTPNYPSVPSVINNLTSDSTTDALSAAQGKALNDGKVNKPIQIGATQSKPWVRICSGTVSTWNSVALVCKVYQRGYANTTALSAYVGNLIFSIFRQNDSVSYPTVRQLYIDSALRISNSGCSFSILHDGLGYYELWIRCATNESKCSILEEYSYNTTIAPSTAYTDSEFSSYITDHSYTRQDFQYLSLHLNSDTVASIGSPTTPVYVDSNGQVQPCDPSQMGVGAASYAEKAKEGCKGSNTATLYIAGTFGDGHLPYYNVKDIKNGCVNYVHVKDIPSNTCSITIEAPALASGEEYDYVVVFDTFTNSNLVGTIDVENCKKAGRFENNVFVVDSMGLTSGNPRYVPMIVVTGNVASSKWYERL